MGRSVEAPAIPRPSVPNVADQYPLITENDAG